MAQHRKAKLTILSGRPAMEDAFLALRAARYHLWNVERQLRAGLSNDEQVSFFHFHLRGFFWEMTAARDSIRRDAKKDGRIRSELDALDESDWFSEVSLYRNFAHQSFHIVEAVKKDGKVL